MDGFGGNFFDSYSGNSGRESNQYFDPYFVKHRKRTTKTQLKILEQTFETNIRPDAGMRKKLGEQLGMTPRSVQVWFQNRRAKIKKLMQKKMIHQENTDNTKDSESNHDSGMPDDRKYGEYCPYTSHQRRGASEDFAVYPMDNSIYKHAVPQNTPSSVMYEGYGYPGQEEYGYPYAQRYGSGEYYSVQYPYGVGTQAWHQMPTFRDDDYYPSSRKQQYNRGGSQGHENM
ncbi:homeodomain-containing transcription factor [Ordospora pajunii]|uniref:homeodomain-containing transcription factor n=1 Tax=Ordospora pajunii TaxID=3039483 RepID=UPI0029526BAB|nr:homeodomain-containing transcription factor [Ordospora pajunii]KAH9411741.1 homeodomain-containing transcription factor [Ordospora pajunii]